MRLITKCVAAVAVVAAVGFAGTATADAHPPRVIIQPSITPYPLPYPYPYPTVLPAPLPRVDIDYVVVYRTSVFAPPTVYGRFETLHGARVASLRLESFGYPVRIVPVRDYYSGWRW